LGLAVVLALGFGGDGRAQTRGPVWSVPVNLGQAVNSPFNEDLPHISRDGLSLYFISNRPTGSPDFDIWVSHRGTSDDPWERPIKLGPNVNTSFTERGPCLSPDGHHLLFSSNRTDLPGAQGSQDLWVSSRADTSDDDGWQTPVNLGSNVNTIYPDFGAALLEDADGAISALLFGRRDNFEGADIYISERQTDGPFARFGQGVVIPELSSKYDDLRPTIRPDGLELFFNSNRPGSQTNDLGRSNDIWVSRRPNLSSPWSTPANLGVRINTAFEEQFPALSADGNTLIFSSNRTGSMGSGTSDLWMSTRQNQWPWP
jgi:Tol biopolymer transport system component